MDKDARYIAVALFVLVSIFLATAFVLWYSGARDSRTFVRYAVYFNGTVSGLSVGSSVRFLGVDVGRVVSVSLDERRVGQVEVTVDVDERAPINAGTVATLKLLGITGLVYLELSQGPDAQEPLKIADGLSLPVIKSVQSDLDRLLTDLPTLVAEITELSARASRILDETNAQRIAETLENSRVASAAIPEVLNESRDAITELRALIASGSDVADSLTGLSSDLAPTIEKIAMEIDGAAASLSRTTQNVEELVSANEAALSTLVGHGSYEVQMLLQESRAAMREIAELSRQLKRNPAHLLLPESGGVEIEP